MIKDVKIFDSDVEYSTDYRNIRYPRLEFKTGKLHLILPLGYNNEKELLEKHSHWIKIRDLQIKKALIDSKKLRLKNRSLIELKQITRKRLSKYKNKINKVYFKKMKSKWGSLSSSRNMTFNTLLKYVPKRIIYYVIFHEITHFKEKKHNEQFWNLIKQEYSNYKAMEKELLIYWFLVQEKD